MRKSKTPTAVTTAVLTLVTIIFAVGFEIYRSLTIKPAPPVPVEIIKPLDPALDTTTLSNIQQRMFFTDDQIGNSQLTVSTPVSAATIAPTLAPVPTSTASATPIPTSSASATPTATP